jgi:hypothetical protein
MRNKLLRALTAGALTLVTVAPAFALCNPGTPNCVTDGGDGSRLAAAKHQVFDPGTFGNCDPGPAGICSDNIGGVPRKAPPNRPTVKSGNMIVAPARR